MELPKISVIMSVYNGEKHLSECIDSILTQTFTNFEFIIVDDASTDNTPQILKKYMQQDARIRILTNAENKERSYSRNCAIEATQSDLIAVMDADDWAYPDRLEKQYAFMQAHPEVTVCGGRVEEYETGKKWATILDNETIHIALIFDVVFSHPTVIYKKSAVQKVGGYRIDMSPAEDYDLWQRLAERKNVKFANISDVLIRYRIHCGVDRSSYREKQKNAANIVQKNILHFIMDEVTDKEISMHNAFCFPTQSNLFQVIFKFPWAYKLYKGFVKSGYSSSIVRRTLIKKIADELRINFAARCKRYTLTRILWNGMRNIKNYLGR